MDILAGTWYAQYLEVKYGDSIDSFVSVMDEFHAGINAVLEKATHENWEQVVVSINESISLFFYQITKNNAYTGRDFIGPDGEKFWFPDFWDDVTDLEMFATMYATVIMELLERDFLFKEAIYLSVIEQLEEGRSEQDVKANLELFAFQASYDIGLQENAKSQ